MNRVTLILAAILIMLLPAARPAAAQDTGTVSGTVVDASGQVLPGATVTLVNEATGDARRCPPNSCVRISGIRTFASAAARCSSARRFTTTRPSARRSASPTRHGRRA